MSNQAAQVETPVWARIENDSRRLGGPSGGFSVISPCCTRRPVMHEPSAKNVAGTRGGSATPSREQACFTNDVLPLSKWDVCAEGRAGALLRAFD